MGYLISDDATSITCGRCGKKSYNPNDVAKRYCGNCHVFHEDETGASAGPVQNFDGQHIIPIDEPDIRVIEWCPGLDAVNPPTQVHVLIRLPREMGEDIGFALRLKTRAGAERLVAAILKHADGVWPPSKDD